MRTTSRILFLLMLLSAAPVRAGEPEPMTTLGAGAQMQQLDAAVVGNEKEDLVLMPEQASPPVQDPVKDPVAGQEPQAPAGGAGADDKPLSPRLGIMRGQSSTLGSGLRAGGGLGARAQPAAEPAGEVECPLGYQKNTESKEPPCIPIPGRGGRPDGSPENDPRSGAEAGCLAGFVANEKGECEPVPARGATPAGSPVEVECPLGMMPDPDGAAGCVPRPAHGATPEGAAHEVTCAEGMVPNPAGPGCVPRMDPLPAAAAEEPADPPCPEGRVRMATGAECVDLPADGSSPHDHAWGDMSGSEDLYCPDFYAKRRTETGWMCEEPQIDCPAGQQARPTPSGWRCEGPTLDCPAGHEPYPTPAGWGCRAAGAVPAPAVAPVPEVPVECPVQFRRMPDGSCAPPEPCPEGQARNRDHVCVPFAEIR